MIDLHGTDEGIVMLLEIHSHTREHSRCSEIAAVDLVRGAVEAGLDGLVITHHHYLWPEEELDELRVDSGCPDDFVLLSGQEVTLNSFDDMLVYGAGEAYEIGLSLSELRRCEPDAAIVWAHPYRGLRQPRPDEVFSPELDAIEVLNRNHRLTRNVFSLKMWKYWGYTGTSGTDVHDELIGVYPCVFDISVRTIDDLVLAVKSGDCRPYLKSVDGQRGKVSQG